MGDRTHVELTTLICFKERATPIALQDSPDDVGENETFITWAFSEVNWGTLGCLEALLKAGIPFESNWDNGSEYTTGTEYLRFNELGDPIRFDVYDDSKNPKLASLLERIDDPVMLRQYILDHKEKITPLPWDNQEEYAKRYLAKRLITKF